MLKIRDTYRHLPLSNTYQAFRYLCSDTVDATTDSNTAPRTRIGEIQSTVI